MKTNGPSRPFLIVGNPDFAFCSRRRIRRNKRPLDPLLPTGRTSKSFTCRVAWGVYCLRSKRPQVRVLSGAPSLPFPLNKLALSARVALISRRAKTGRNQASFAHQLPIKGRACLRVKVRRSRSPPLVHCTVSLAATASSCVIFLGGRCMTLGEGL